MTLYKHKAHNKENSDIYNYGEGKNSNSKNDSLFYW